MSGRDGPGDAPRADIWHRLLHGPDDLSAGERFRAAVLKPADPAAPPPEEPAPRSVEEVQDAERYADDRERLIGLVAAPLAAAIGYVIARVSISDNPAAPNPAHANPTTYYTLEFVLLALALVMLGSAWYRKRLFLGMSMALYGLGVFNLHYWGFGVPFLLGGAWYLVRAYRAHQAVRDATGGGGSGSGPSRPRANKRYTPPT
jgi:hypothetical protein